MKIKEGSMAGQAVEFITLVDSSHFCTLQLQNKTFAQRERRRIKKLLR